MNGTMRLRSWPKRAPANRAFVSDLLPRLWIDRYDYSPLIAYSTFDAVAIVEWDMALSAEHWTALDHPRSRVATGAYRLYPASTGQPRAVWAHGHADRSAALGPSCTSFGFGALYIPGAVLRAWFDERGPDMPMTDTTFSAWYVDKFGPADVVWDCQPVHLHY